MFHVSSVRVYPANFCKNSIASIKTEFFSRYLHLYEIKFSINSFGTRNKLFQKRPSYLMYRTLKSESYSLSNIIIPDEQPLAWNIEPQRSALLVHDMQRYFVDALPCEPVDTVIHSISLILKWARINEIPVFYSAQPGGMTPEQRGLLNDLWGPGMRTTEDERKIITELTPSPGDTVLTKWRYSAFYRSPLAEMLKNDQRDSLIITGIYASVGISATAIDAFTQDIKPFVTADGIADFSLAGHQQAINYLADNCAKIISTDGVVNNV